MCTTSEALRRGKGMVNKPPPDLRAAILDLRDDHRLSTPEMLMVRQTGATSKFLA